MGPAGRAGASRELARFAFTGVGYRTSGDAWLAESAAARASEQRRVAREELRPGRWPQCWLAINGLEVEMVQERYITAREVAERVGLSADTVLRYYREGRIPGRRLHGRIRPVRFLWSEVGAAWDGSAQLSIEDRVA